MYIVGIGGTTRPGSSTESVLRHVLAVARNEGAEVVCFAGADLALPFYEPSAEARTREAASLVEAVRAADGLVLASPGYHGTISGLVKNALDHVEDTARDERPYFDGLPVGCVTLAYGWQASVNTLGALRDVVHALRGIPTPYGAALNSSTPLFPDGVCAPDVDTALTRVGQQVTSMARRLGR